jgi:hypothetical protein
LFYEIGLSDLDVEVLAWVYHDGLSLAQIGELLGVDRSTVRDRLVRCHAAMTRAGLPLPQRPKRTPLKRRIHLGGDSDLADKLVRGELPPLLTDKPYADEEPDAAKDD